MTTYRNESDVPMVGGDVPGAPHAGDTTRWFYDEPSGCMTNKVYADGKGPFYSYTPDGKLARRTWARGIATDYTYDNAGQLVLTSYSDDTPTITMSYDRVGNLINATTAGVVTNLYAYDLHGHCTNEWQNDFNLTRYYDALGRSTGYAINGTRQTTIAYDTYGRIATMRTAEGRSGVLTASNENEFAWSYLPNSDFKASLQYPNGLTASWTYDANNQLLQVCNATPTNVISQFDYTYDAAGRRVSIVKSGSAFGDLSGSVDTYTYNARSELTSARRTKNGQPIPGFSEDFDYDPIGNRRSSATYNEKGEAQTSTYQANNLNQYTSRTTPGYAAVRGEADHNAFVTVNENPAFRFGSYFFGSDLFDNTAAGGLANLETYAVLREEKVGGGGEEENDLFSATTNQVYLAQSPETFAYDDDGNQTLVTTKTGTWRVTYNGENRPVRWTRINATNTNDQMAVLMSFDHQGRRRKYLETAADGSTNRLDRFTYDNYLCVARNRWQQDGTFVADRFTWDPTEPVATRPLVFYQPNAPLQLYSIDGNKNVSELVSASDGSISAHYEYAPFGEVILSSGDHALTNPFRFSSEYADDAISLVYYNFRHLDPVTGRWLQNDLIEESGGINLYVYLFNNVVFETDLRGLKRMTQSFARYDFDKDNCILNVTLRWWVHFNVRYMDAVSENWTEHEKSDWKAKAKKSIEGYFNSSPFRCDGENHCCNEGIKVNVSVQFTERSLINKLFQSDPDCDSVVVVTKFHVRSHVNPDSGRLDCSQNDVSLGQGHRQIVIVHEVGHLLGLNHPGMYTHQAENSKADYEEAYNGLPGKYNLMGSGMALHYDDFKRAFCDHIRRE